MRAILATQCLIDMSILPARDLSRTEYARSEFDGDESNARTDSDSMTEPPSAVVSDADLVRQLIGGSHDALAVLYDRHSSVVSSRPPCGRVAITGSPRRSSRRRSSRSGTARNGSIRPGVAGRLAGDDRPKSRDRSPPARPAATSEPPPSRRSVAGCGRPDDGRVAHGIRRAHRVRRAGAGPGDRAGRARRRGRRSRTRWPSLAPSERQRDRARLCRGTDAGRDRLPAGWPLGTVKTRTRRALRHLRDRLEASPVSVAGRRRAVFEARSGRPAS